MARKITKTVYKFEELSDQAKEKARDWWRQSLGYDEWWDGVYEDADQASLKITGFDLDRADISGRFTADACSCAHLIQDNHGEDCETYKTAVAFLAARDNTASQGAGVPGVGRTG